MRNRFLEMDTYLKEVSGKTPSRRVGQNGNGYRGETSYSRSASWSSMFSVQERVLVVLLENGGVDLGIPDFVNRILSLIPGLDQIPDKYKQQLVEHLRKKITEYSDNLLETFELTLNRYKAAKPNFYGDVTVLRNGTATLQDLKNTLTTLTQNKKIIDLLVLTHGGDNRIAVSNGVDVTGEDIKSIKTSLGRPLSIRSVYMMNCVGASLNKAWIESGAKVSSGSIRNNYLPEPTTYFFWKNWKEGKSFETAATSAYEKTIDLMNGFIRGFVSSLPIPGSSLLANLIKVEELDFVRDSAPMVQGEKTLTISSDQLTFTQSHAVDLASATLPARMLQLITSSRQFTSDRKQSWMISQRGVDLIKGFEGFKPNLYNDPVGHCTIGYGTLVHQGNCNGAPTEQPFTGGVTEERAAQLLMDRVNEFQRTINDCVTVELNQNQYDSLCSFVYNIGSANFQQSTLLKLLNQGKHSSVGGEMRKWTKARQNGQLVELPGLVSRRKTEADLFDAPTISEAQSIYDRYSRPFFDTGEHVLAGAGEYEGRLRVGKNPGVMFSYGQIISIAADLYGSPWDMMAADVTELQKIKTLVERSEKYYRELVINKKKISGDVSNDEWDTVTSGRYLELAENNYEHFAPNVLFKDEPFAKKANRFGNNQSAWEYYHKTAIEAAQKLFLQNPNASVFPEWPLILNAFADHFLTDAFSSGHIFNKEAIIEYFKMNFLNGSSLKPAGTAFFKKVAQRAFKGEVAKKFSQLETADYPVCAWGFCLKWHPNINSADRFSKVLIGAAEQQPDRIGNFCAKALHDRLNKDGIEVTNKAGDGTWRLMGDSHLDQKNLTIIQKAVQQSIANINDPAIRASNLNFSAFYKKVWDHVPELTPGSAAYVKKLTKEYVSPDSDLLAQTAADIIGREVNAMIKTLLNERKLKAA